MDLRHFLTKLDIFLRHFSFLFLLFFSVETSLSSHAFWKINGAFFTIKKIKTNTEQPVISHPQKKKTVTVAF